MRAISAVVADLLKAMTQHPFSECYRPMGAGDFKELTVGYHPTRRVLDDLERHRFIIKKPGKAPFKGEPGVVTRILPTPRFAEFLLGHGITPANRTLHFTYPKAWHSSEPLRLKAGRTYGRNWKKVAGAKMPVDYSHPKAAAYAEQVKIINGFLAEQEFSFSDEVTLFRGFNVGDHPAFDWNMGGRLFCYGGGYQSLSKNDRKSITINGQRTIELDISACHITIAHGVLGVPLPNRRDLYDIDDLPREIVKSYVTLFLGQGKAPRAWTSDHREEYDKDALKRLGRDYPISKVGESVLNHLPVLHNVAEQKMNWATLQFIESQIIVNAMDRLVQEQGVCTLPVHDSMIFIHSHRLIVENYLSQAFYEHTGYNPVLKV